MAIRYKFVKMKKIIFLMLVVFFLTNCELKFNSANAKYVYNSYACYSYREEIKQGMRYGIWYNSFDMNFDALKTLQVRLHEIEKMDITSFQYQTAIQQITSQEQGDAMSMLTVFEGTWFKENHFLLWGWVCSTLVIILIVLFFVGIIIWNWESLSDL
jgi:hypothetical protein